MQSNYEIYINASRYIFYMKQEMVVISRKEYEGMKETIEILQNPEMMKQILESEKNIKQGKIKKLNF